MANLLKMNNGMKFPNLIKHLSSFSNNRTKTGLISIVQNTDFNLSEFEKQFNANKKFPLPGNTGILIEVNEEKITKKELELENTKQEIISENFDYLLNKPLTEEIQSNKLKTVVTGLQLTGMNIGESNECVKPVFELKAYNCPRSLMDDFQSYFRLNSIGDGPMTVITISFKTENDMSTWNSQVDAERETVTEQFVNTAQEVCDLFEQEGFWADFIDPSSGSLHKSPFTHATFYETDERYRHLGFEIIDNGCCKVVSHHEWGTKTYVGAILTNASSNGKLLQQIINKKLAKV